MKKVIEIGNIKIGEGIPKICVPIVGKTKKEIVEEAILIKEAKADLVEWRVDFFQNINQWEDIKDILIELKKILKHIPILFTIRTLEEGGNLKISLEEYLDLNIMVIESGLIELIDIEYEMGCSIKSLIQKAREAKIYTVISSHNFEITPNKFGLIDKMCKMQKINGDIIKIAVMPKSSRDVLTLIEATEEMTRCHADRPLITMSMSSLGSITRLSGEIFGSDITFATIGKESAPGQIPVDKVKAILSLLHEGLN